MSQNNIQIALYQGFNSPNFTVENRWRIKSNSIVEIRGANEEVISVEILPTGGFKLIILDRIGTDLELVKNKEGTWKTQ